VLPVIARFGPWTVLGHSLGPLSLYSFGLMLMIAFLLGGHLYSRELGRRGLDPELSGAVVTWGVIGGVVGARLYYILENWQEFRRDMAGALFSGSGLVAWGGLAGGAVACWLALRRRRAPLLQATDAAAPILALGWVFGRLGCFLAGDGDYGPPTDLPWGMAFPNGIVPTTARVHPTPLYEAAMMLAVFALLWRLRLRPWRPGRLFAAYLALQGGERLVAEVWRTNPRHAGMTAAQWIGLGLAIVGLVWLKATPASEPSPAAPSGA
jgi:phosphatidylglycerol:prolipoprotein diacylglycerol transferase